jgi:hypothetical protein
MQPPSIFSRRQLVLNNGTLLSGTANARLLAGDVLGILSGALAFRCPAFMLLVLLS